MNQSKGTLKKQIDYLQTEMKRQTNAMHILKEWNRLLAKEMDYLKERHRRQSETIQELHNRPFLTFYRGLKRMLKRRRK